MYRDEVRGGPMCFGVRDRVFVRVVVTEEVGCLLLRVERLIAMERLGLCVEGHGSRREART